MAPSKTKQAKPKQPKSKPEKPKGKEASAPKARKPAGPARKGKAAAKVEGEAEVAAPALEAHEEPAAEPQESDPGAEPETLASEAPVPDEAATVELPLVDEGVMEMTLDPGGLTAGAGEGSPPEAAAGAGETAAEGAEGEGGASAEGLSPEKMEAAIESLLFASDKPLTVNELKRLLGVRDGKAVAAALEALCDHRAQTGVLVVNVANGWSLRTNPAFGPWVGKLLAGKPVRLSRAMLETLAIIAYRQPVTRPELDEIRGVDCGPVLHTLLDRNLIRIIGKKEEVGRPMLYGTTPEFLRVFSLKDLTELPTLRQFHELTAEHQAKVQAAHGGGEKENEGEAAAAAPPPAPSAGPLAAAVVGPDPDEDDGLLDELERATESATRAAGPLNPEPESPT